MKPIIGHILFIAMVLLLFVGILFCIGNFGGCTTAPVVQVRTPDAATVGTPELVRVQKRKLEEIKPRLIQLRATVDTLNIATVEAVRPQLQQMIGGPNEPAGIYRDFTDLTSTTDSVETSVVHDVQRVQALEKENAKLRADDPARKNLDRAGFWLSLGGVAFIIASFFVGQWIPLWTLQIRMAGIFMLAVGLCAYSLSWFLVEIRLAIIILLGVALLAGLVWAVIWAVRNRSLLFQNIKKIEEGKKAGQILFTPEASDPKKSAVMKDESPVLAAMVDKVQVEMANPRTG